MQEGARALNPEEQSPPSPVEVPKRPKCTPFWVVVVVMVVLIAVDQWIKTWVRGHLAEHQVIAKPWPGVMELTLTYNRGVAFGMMQGLGLVLTPIAIAIIIWALWYSYHHRYSPRLLHIGMALLSAGAVGNMIDRFAFKKVTDMFWCRAINFPVFNFADSCITISVFILGIYWLFLHHEPQGAEALPDCDSSA